MIFSKNSWKKALTPWSIQYKSTMESWNNRGRFFFVREEKKGEKGFSMNKLVLGLFLGVFLSFFLSCTVPSDSSSSNKASSRPIKLSSIPEYPHPEKIQAYPLPDNISYRYREASPLTVLNHRLLHCKSDLRVIPERYRGR
jgi:hypothetical protein